MTHIQDYFLSRNENKRVRLSNIAILFLRTPKGKKLESGPLWVTVRPTGEEKFLKAGRKDPRKSPFVIQNSHFTP